MKFLLLTVLSFLSVSLFSQNEGIVINIELLNAPSESVDGSISFTGEDGFISYSLTISGNSFSQYYPNQSFDWNTGQVSLVDCNGDFLTGYFSNSDSISYYSYSFVYCQSDSIFGCTDPTALNYQPEANIDNGSCIYEGASNDLCADATHLAVGSTLIDNSFTPLNEGIIGECWNFGSGEGEQTSLWFTFTTPAQPAEISIETVADGSNTLTDTQFGLFTECGGEMIYCDGNSGEGLLSAFNFSCGELDTNATYILIVDGWNGDAGTCFLNFDVSSPCGNEVLGCTDPSASNYSPLATIDDGSCSYLDSCNFMIDASPLTCSTFEFLAYSPGGQMGSGMTWTINGAVVDPTSNPMIWEFTESGVYEVCYNIVNDGFWCDGLSEGCTTVFVEPNCFTECPVIDYALSDSISSDCTYAFSLINPDTPIDSIFWSIGNEPVFIGGSMVEYQFSEPGFYEVCAWADNFDCDSICTGLWVDSCSNVLIYGCTDPAAINFNPEANTSDGSCEYLECENNEVIVLINTENWGYEISWNIRNEEGNEVAGSGDYPNYSTITELACLEDGCYTFEMFDSYGDGWNGGSFTILLGDTALASGTLEDEEFGSISFGVNAEGCVEEDVFGCTDPSAVNFNPNATVEDGSCTYECTDVSVGFDFTAGSPNSDNFMVWTLYDESLQTPIDTGVFNGWADFVGLCLEDGCYTFVIGNIPSEWEGIYNVLAGNEFVSFGEFSGDTSSVEFTFGVNTDGCGEIEEFPGCTDPEALNYNPQATIDDGSCDYSCTDISLGFDFDTYPNDSSYANMYWTMTNQENGEIQSQPWYEWAPQYDLCLNAGCYTFEVFNVPSEWIGFYYIYGDSGNIAQGAFSGEQSTFSINFGIQAEGCTQVDDVYGCTDAEAINYNPEATIDDGSCAYDFECGIGFEVMADSSGGNMFYIIPSENIVNASNVLWDFGDGNTSAEYYPSHIYEGDGPYLLCLFVTFEDSIGNFCQISYCEELDGSTFGSSGVLSGGFMINIIQQVTLSNNDDLTETKIEVYPNPTNDFTTISYLSQRSENLTLSVSDLTGKVLQQRIFSSSIGQQKMQIDLSELPQGLYLIGLEQNGSRSYAKVVRR